ncbi:MAG TPA: nuclear transport factor 2 family protein [Longimicrobiales bacterium]|nr:nuclear transport factor 2 family protein [Longimicrobiales bacterium]
MTDPVEQQLDAYNRRDIDAFLDAFARGVHVEDALGNRLMTGKSQMRPPYEKMFRNSPDLQCVVATRIDVADWVFTDECVSGLVMEGAPIETRGVAAYHVKNGKIHLLRLYF